MSYIGTQQGTAAPVLLDAITVVNNQAAYTMQKGGVNYSPASTLVMQVSLNGIIQAPTSSYTINGSIITFASALVTGDVIDYILVREPTTGTIAPVDGSVTDSKIVSVSSSKLTGALPALDGSALTGVSAGKVLQVVSTNKTDTFSTTSTSFVDVTGLSVQITPSATSSKILVTGALVCSASQHFLFARLMRDSTQVLVPDGAGSFNRSVANFGFSTYQASTYMNGTIPIHALDSPSSTSALTYKIQMQVYAGTSYVNRSERDSDNSLRYDMRGVSTITVAEIEG